MTSFQEIKLLFETAESTPPPYSYKYELIIQPSFQYLSVELSMTYTDRDEIGADEIEAEGFTNNDDFSWKGRLEKVWRDELEKLLAKTQIKDKKQDEDSDLLAIEISAEDRSQIGQPSNRKDWDYLSQQLLQAIFEASGKERAFELNILKKTEVKQETKLLASFVNRQITLSNDYKSKDYEWEDLSYLMQIIFASDYIQEAASTNKPKKQGLFVEFGDGLWYEMGQQVVEVGTKSNTVPKLIRLLEKLIL